MARRNDKATPLQPTQKRALRLLANGTRPSQVARELGIGRRTLWNWRQLPRFEKQLATYLRELEEYSERKEKHALAQAWDTIMNMMTSQRPLPRTVAQSRVAAVQLVLTTLNRRADHLKVQHVGNVRHQHQADVTVDSRKLSSEKKERLRELLALTRELDTPNAGPSHNRA